MIVRTTDSDYDIALNGSEDEEDAVEKDLDDDTDAMYDVVDTGNHGQPENPDSETGESTDEETNVFQGKDFTWSRTPPKVARARRENIIVRLTGCVDEAENANPPNYAFLFFISDYILNIILTHTNGKSCFSPQFHWQGSEMDVFFLQSWQKSFPVSLVMYTI
jgi:hypothetical protein